MRAYDALKDAGKASEQIPFVAWPKRPRQPDQALSGGCDQQSGRIGSTDFDL